MASSVAEIAKGLSVGIIMDGNGRWAKKRMLPRTAGHIKGLSVFQDITRYCNELGLAAVTFYAFSTENWVRPADEVTKIMELLKEYLLKAYDYTAENNRVVFLGSKDPFDSETRVMMEDIEEKTRYRTGMVMNIAANYGGRQEILTAAKKLAVGVQNGLLTPEDITEDIFEECLYTAGQPMPDIILRPSGEKRISNFLLWQCAYSEFIYMDVLWPDFTRADFDTALLEYATRQRRFGGV